MGSLLLAAGAGAGLAILLLALGVFIARAVRGAPPPLSIEEEEREGEASAPAAPAAAAAELPPAVRAIWESLLRGEVFLLPASILIETPAHITLFALAARQEQWQPDGTRTPCLLGIEELVSRYPRTPTHIREGKTGISLDYAVTRMKDLRRGAMDAVTVDVCATNRLGEGFRSLLPCDPVQRSTWPARVPLSGEAAHELRPPQRPQTGDLESGGPSEGRPTPVLECAERPTPDLQSAAPTGAHSSTPDLECAASRSPGPGSGPGPRPEEPDPQGGVVLDFAALSKSTSRGQRHG